LLSLKSLDGRKIMDYTSCDKDTVSALIEILMAGVKNDNLAEADALLAGLRVLRPQFRELETFDAWLLIKRKKYREATHILRNLTGGDQNMASMPVGTALLALCLFVANDPTWIISANEVLARNEDPEAVTLVNLLFGKNPDTPAGEETAEAPPAAPTAADLMFTHYLRA
jgi:type III secretion protein HrpB1